MQSVLLVVLALAAICNAATLKIDAELNESWEEFKNAYSKNYGVAEAELGRRLIWEDNVRYIRKHNIEYDLGLHTYTLGVNQFADLTTEEFRANYLGLARPPRGLNDTKGSTYMAPLNIGDLPDTVDWRTSGYVTEVKNQGQCGSCWSFSTTGSVEGQYKRKTGQLVSLSEQQLVDCSRQFGNLGCNGGLMTKAFKYIESFGIERESDYPYTAHDGQCQYDASKIVTKVAGYTNIPRGHEDDLQKAVATEGPVSVAIDASHKSFHLYKQGVYNEIFCSSSNLDHGVLAVGYGKEGGHDYWLVKNSWGASWGDNGYIKMSRNKRNQCGIATDASYPQL